MPPGMQHPVVMWEHADLHLMMEAEGSSEKSVLEHLYHIIQLKFQKTIIQIFTATETKFSISGLDLWLTY